MDSAKALPIVRVELIESKSDAMQSHNKSRLADIPMACVTRGSEGILVLERKGGEYQLNWKPLSKAIVDDLRDFVMVCARTGKCPGIDPQRQPPGLLHQQSITVDRQSGGA